MNIRFLSFLLPLTTAVADPVAYDIVVYGGTSGGVAAAVQAARSGKSVVLISPTTHLGGLTTSGLGWTDLGKSSILGGISREFYSKLYQHYQDDAAWTWQTRASYGNAGQGSPAFNATTQIASVFEPKVAKAVFEQLIAQEEVPVITGRIDLENGVVMSSGKISRLKLEDGREFAGKMFIDASYEGDLLPGAGVTFTVGREANAKYDETINGVQANRALKNQLPNGIDPYVIKGNAASGLLPGVEAEGGPADGTADDRLQAYCFRMVLTDVPENRVSIAQPPGYDEADYELLFRAIEVGQTSGFFKFDLMPNRKTDSNNTGGISTDYIGKNYGPGWNWATLNHDERIALAKKHENWQRGLVWTLQNHSRVPSAIRNNYGKWGLPADEFTDNGNWPWQIYVREARRLVSDYVMTQHHCNGTVVAADSIGLGAYAMDSHHVRRHVKNGMVKNEGDVQLALADAYPISYRSIVPKKGECPNLLVPWSLSASHMAFGSIRMEPVFMALSQSAAIAAGLAIDQDIAVQDVAYAELRPLLTSSGQALGDAFVSAPTSVIDNTHPSLVEITGTWISTTSTGGYAGADYLHDNNVGQGTNSVFYRVNPDLSGMQRVFLRWTSHANRASNVTVEIRHKDGTSNVSVDQRSNGGKWNLLGFHTFTGAEGEGIVIKTTGANGYVIADAVGFSAVGENDDSDGDGITDQRELILGLDPNVSDASFIQAVKDHPDFFSLHAPGEILDLRVSQPRFTSALELDFSLEEGSGAFWEPIEDFLSPVPAGTDRGFYRIALQTEPSSLVQKLSAGQPRKIVVYGTSLTAGGAWVGEMRNWLTSTYPGAVTVINSGLSGKNSVEGIAQLETKVLAHNPDVVFIEFAMNDAFTGPNGPPIISVSQARSNLLTMIDAILERNPDAQVILQTMNTVWDSPGGTGSATLRPHLEDYYQMYREVAAEKNLLLIDHHSNWKKLQETDSSSFQTYVPDGVHPATSGIRQVVMPLIKWKLAAGKH